MEGLVFVSIALHLVKRFVRLASTIKFYTTIGWHRINGAVIPCKDSRLQLANIPQIISGLPSATTRTLYVAD